MCERCKMSPHEDCRTCSAVGNPPEAQQALFSALPEVVDSKTAATALSIPERTVRELARNGEVRGFKIGSVWRFTRQSLTEFVVQQEREGTERERK